MKLLEQIEIKITIKRSFSSNLQAKSDIEKGSKKKIKK